MAVRKVLAMLLLMVFSFPLVSPVFALGRGARESLPICCRAGGKHHCAMNRADREKLEESGEAAGTVQWSAPVERCPYYPRVTTSNHLNVLGAGAGARAFDALLSHSAGVAQTESKWRSARDRSRQKRGPPAFVG